MTFLLGSTLKVSIVLLAGLAAATLLRRRSAAARHWVIAVSLVCAMVLPALELAVPAWALPSAWSAATATPPAERERGDDGGTASPPLEFSETVTVPHPSPGRTGVLRFLTPAWIAGACLSLFVLSVGLARLTWLASRARPVEAGRWTRLADEIGRDLALGRPVRLLESDHPSLLVTWGLFVPKVILPRAAQSWTDERAAIVLRHELAHIRRGDWVIQITGELLRTVYWFNPLVWMACARLRQESEQACDDEVLTSGVDGPDYATHLVDLARLLKTEGAPRLPAPAIARSSSLERRIRAMLDARLTRTPATRVARFMTAGALIAFTVALAAAQTGPVTFSGSVVDQSGAPVPGATVVLANTRNKSKFEVTSNDSGKFDFVPLPADTYALVVTLPGFKKNETTVTLSGKAMSHLVFLQLGELQETISVRAQRNQAARQDDGRKSPEYGRTAFLRDLDKCETSTSGGRVRPPRKIKDVKPIYPDGLREAGIAGKVGLKATIAVDGTVRDVQVVSSAHADLDAAAMEAVRQWLFDGTLLNCTPVEVTMNVSVDFGIQ